MPIDMIIDNVYIYNIYGYYPIINRENILFDLFHLLFCSI